MNERAVGASKVSAAAVARMTLNAKGEDRF